MRFGIVSDIHSNLPAFEAVLADMGPVDELWCLGDLVGYGPEPNQCIDLLRGYRQLCIVGNHDLAAIGGIDTSDFNDAAAAAASWTASVLSPSSRLFLESLPQRLVVEPFTLVHGSPREPVWEYITHEGRAAPNFPLFDTQGCLVGHTHSPALFVEGSEQDRVLGAVPEPGYSLPVAARRFIANPGGVGQPRDGDPRAAYAIYDDASDTLEWKRVAYPIEVTQERMREVGLPSRLVERLSHGW